MINGYRTDSGIIVLFLGPEEARAMQAAITFCIALSPKDSATEDIAEAVKMGEIWGTIDAKLRPLIIR